jgi:hypothetical protein
LKCEGVLEYWSAGVLGLKAEKYILFFILSAFLYGDPSMVHICPLSQPFIIPLLHHSNTPDAIDRPP